jgi:hypothetical protein
VHEARADRGGVGRERARSQRLGAAMRGESTMRQAARGLGRRAGDDRVDRRRRVAQRVCGRLQLRRDRGAEEPAGPGDVHASEAQVVHRTSTVRTRA